MKLTFLIPAAATLFFSVAMLAQDKPAAPAAAKPAAPAKIVLTEAEFLKIVAADCGRCHKRQCTDLNALKTARWLKPGDPSMSKLYTTIGRHKRLKDGTIVTVTPEHKQAISDFIASLKP